ncbi:MAG: hypothetical protein NZ935_10540, partial [Planctomycetes bacterium]|nr:hypothetical protein [Planctomycetota bacterium]
MNLPGFLRIQPALMASLALFFAGTGEAVAADTISKTALRGAVKRGTELVVGRQESLGPRGTTSSEWPY